MTPEGETAAAAPVVPPTSFDAAAAPSARADLVWALVWVIVGAAIFIGGYGMDRLEAQHINPYTAPGLVPALLGIGMVLLGVLLFARSYARAGGREATTSGASGADLGRLFAALVLCIGYAAGLVGRGPPFWLSTFVFVFAAIAVFEWRERKARGEVRRGLLVAAACAVGTAGLVTLVFQEVFLVRLP